MIHRRHAQQQAGCARVLPVVRCAPGKAQRQGGERVTGKRDVHTVPPEVALDFLKDIMPFNTLEQEALNRVAASCRIDFFPKGSRLFTAGETEVSHLHLIQRGGVKSFIVDDEGEVTLKDYRGEGASIGALAIIHGTTANLNVETVEDTFCFLIPRQIFLELINDQPGFAQYYLKRFSDKVVSTAYSELRRHKWTRRGDDELYLFTMRAGDLIKTLRKIGAGASIQQAAAEMARHKVGSLLIHRDEDPEDIVGIITDRDLRTKVIAQGLDYSLPVERIMSSPVQRVLSRSICFDVLLKMMSTNIHHLAVERGNRIIGVITSHDIMLQQGHSPYYLFKEIISQSTIQGLYPLAQKIPDMIRNLIKEGGKAGNIASMIAVLNDYILERMLTLLQEEMGNPPVPYCWLLMGSEGRREQTFRTDQDNAIIYADPADDKQRQAAANYFGEFARRAIDHLVNCGYPLCPGEIMARNPKWCQPYSVWRGYFDRWIAAPDPEELLNVMIFFDFRSGFGTRSLADDLRNHLIKATRRQEIYLLHLAKDCLAYRAPISFFRTFMVEKNGEHKNTLDIKRQGITPFVNFARVMALKYSVKETNTLARFRVLAEEKHISADLEKAAVEAYELQMQLRLVHQLYQIDKGHIPDNHINPAHLTELEKRMLKDAFSVIDRLQSVLKTVFPVV
jgi:CBS domain-containing protein